MNIVKKYLLLCFAVVSSLNSFGIGDVEVLMYINIINSDGSMGLLKTQGLTADNFTWLIEDVTTGTKLASTDAGAKAKIIWNITPLDAKVTFNLAVLSGLPGGTCNAGDKIRFTFTVNKSTDPYHAVVGIKEFTALTSQMVFRNNIKNDIRDGILLEIETIEPKISVAGVTLCAGDPGKEVVATITDGPADMTGYTMTWGNANITTKPGSLTSASATGVVGAGLVAGTYTLKAQLLKNGTKVAESANYTVTVNAVPTVTIKSGETTACAGDKKTITAQGATTYEWKYNSGVVGGPTASYTTPILAVANSPYTYTVSGTTAGCKSTPVTHEIVVNPLPGVTIATGAFCVGTPAYTIDATVTGSGGPYTYTWTKPATITTTTTLTAVVNDLTDIPGLVISNASTLAAGSYTNISLTVATAAGCSAKDTKSLTVNAKPAAVLAGLEPVCEGGPDVTATVTSSPDFSYAWSLPQAQTGATLKFKPQTKGTVSFAVRVTSNSTTCYVDLQKDLVVNAKPTVTFTVSTPEGCFEADLVLKAEGAGGTDPYTYEWTGAGTSGTGATVNTTIQAGNNSYTVKAKDAKGCYSDVTAPQDVLGHKMVLTLTATPNPVSNGGTATLGVTAVHTPAVGASVAGYAWTPGDKITGDPKVMGPTTVALATDQLYDVTVTDNFGCSVKKGITVNVTGSALAVTATGGSECQGTVLTLGCTPRGGSGAGNPDNYTYTWTPSAGLTLSNVKVQNPVVHATTPPGRYTASVVITDDNGKATSNVVDVVVKMMPQITNVKATPDSDINQVTSVLTATVEPPTADIAWEPKEKIFSGEKTTNATTVALTDPLTTFTISASLDGCIAPMQSVDVRVTTSQLMLTTEGASGCKSQVFTVKAIVKGGVPTYDYTWGASTPAGVVLSDSKAASPKVQNVATLAAGDYVIPVTVRDTKGQSKEGTATITVFGDVVANGSGLCNNATSFDGQITVTAGAKPYTLYSDAGGTNVVGNVRWNDDGTVATLANLVSGTSYTYYVKDKNKCNVAPVNILTDCSCGAQLVMILGQKACALSGDDIDITLQASGGNSYSFDLVNVELGTKVLQIRNEGATEWTYPVKYADRGKYRVDNFVAVTDATDPGTCEGNVTPKTVDVQFFPAPQVQAGQDVLVCGNGEVTLKANGDTGLTFTWDNNIQDGVPFTPVMSTITTYTVTGRDVVSGCENTDEVVVTVNLKPNVAAMATPNVVCRGEVVTLSHNGTADTYEWNNGGQTGPNNIPEVTTRYRVTGTSTLTGCSDTAGVTVVVNLPAEITEKPKDRTIAIGKNVTYKVKAIGNGLSYEWQWWNPQTSLWSTFMDNTQTAPKISGSTTEELALQEVPAAWDGRKVKCVVRGDCGNPQEAEAMLWVKECFDIVADIQMMSGIRPNDVPGAAVDGWYCKGNKIAIKALVNLADPENGTVANPHFTWTIDGLLADKTVESDSSVLTWIPESYEDDIVVRVCVYSDGACMEVCSRHLRLKARTPDDVRMQIVTSIDPERAFCPGDTIDFTVATEHEGNAADFHWYRDIFDKGLGRKKTFVMDQKDTWVRVVFVPSTELCIERSVEDSVFLSVKKYVNPTLRIENNIGDTIACRNDAITFHAIWTDAGVNPSIAWRKDVWDWGTGEYATAVLEDKDMWIKCTLIPGNDVCFDQPALMDTMVIRVREGGSVSITAEMSDKTMGDELTFISEVKDLSGTWSYEWYVNSNLTPCAEKDYITDLLKQGDVVECAVVGELVCQNRMFSNAIVVDYNGGINRDTMLYIYKGEVIKNLDMVKPGDHPGQTIFMIDIAAKYGMGTITPNGKFFYIPYPGFVGTDYVKYVILDRKTKEVLAEGYIYITVKDSDKFFVPNLITPNDDGLNDTWKLDFIADYPDHLIQVFDRNSNLVFEARNYQNDWGGAGMTTSGYVGHVNLINGIYTYIIDLGDKDKTILKSWIEIRANMNRRNYR